MTMDAEVIDQIERYAAWLESQLGPVEAPHPGALPTVVPSSTASSVRRRSASILAAAAAVLVVVVAAGVLAARDPSPGNRTAPVSGGSIDIRTDQTTATSDESTPASIVTPLTASESPPPSDTVMTAVPTSDPGSTVTAGLASGAWASARTSADGRQVLVQVIGAAPFKAGDPCTADYSATTQETPEQVTVEISGVRPSGIDICPSIGYPRSLTIDLAEPLGDRRFIALGEVRDVFDGADLARVAWMPASWSIRDQGPVGISGWQRTWSPDRPGSQNNRCTPSDPGLTLFEQPADAPDPWQPEMGAELVGEYEVNGAAAVLTSVLERNASTLSWTIDDRSFALRTAQACQGDPDVDLDTFLTIARNITPASGSEVRDGLLTLSVSNQSSTEDPIELTVTIDGFRALRDEFVWEGGHNWIEYELPLTIGRHDITITTPDGITKRASFEIPDNGQLWAVINYWYAPAGATSSGMNRAIEFRTDTERIFFD